MDWIQLAQEIVQWRTLVRMVINLRLAHRTGIFLTIWATVSFRIMSMFREVSCPHTDMLSWGHFVVGAPWLAPRVSCQIPSGRKHRAACNLSLHAAPTVYTDSLPWNVEETAVWSSNVIMITFLFLTLGADGRNARCSMFVVATDKKAASYFASRNIHC